MKSRIDCSYVLSKSVIIFTSLVFAQLSFAQEAQPKKEENVDQKVHFVTEAVFVGGKLILTTTTGNCRTAPIFTGFNIGPVKISKTYGYKATVKIAPYLRSTPSNFKCANSSTVMVMILKSHLVESAKESVREKIKQDFGEETNDFFVEYEIPPVQISPDF